MKQKKSQKFVLDNPLVYGKKMPAIRVVAAVLTVLVLYVVACITRLAFEISYGVILATLLGGVISYLLIVMLINSTKNDDTEATLTQLYVRGKSYDIEKVKGYSATRSKNTFFVEVVFEDETCTFFCANPTPLFLLFEQRLKSARDTYSYKEYKPKPRFKAAIVIIVLFAGVVAWGIVDAIGRPFNQAIYAIGAAILFGLMLLAVLAGRRGKKANAKLKASLLTEKPAIIDAAISETDFEANVTLLLGDKMHYLTCENPNELLQSLSFQNPPLKGV